MKTKSIILEGEHVRLEPLSLSHEAALTVAADDGEQWKSTVTIVPAAELMSEYIATALREEEAGRELPFVIVRKSSEQVVGTTRLYFIDPENRTLEIGYTWLAASAQRTVVNTEAKKLLLTYAFEELKCIRVGLVTDVLNERSRKAILRLGAKEEGILRKPFNHAGWSLS